MTERKEKHLNTSETVFEGERERERKAELYLIADPRSNCSEDTFSH